MPTQDADLLRELAGRFQPVSWVPLAEAYPAAICRRLYTQIAQYVNARRAGREPPDVGDFVSELAPTLVPPRGVALHKGRAESDFA
jgi:hypothetical protein